MGFFINEDFQYFLEFGQPHNRSPIDYDAVKKLGALAEDEMFTF